VRGRGDAEVEGVIASLELRLVASLVTLPASCTAASITRSSAGLAWAAARRLAAIS
jgi:hypothetical protein